MTYFAKLIRDGRMIAEYRLPRPFPAIEELSLALTPPKERCYRLTRQWCPFPTAPSLVYLRYEEEPVA